MSARELCAWCEHGASEPCGCERRRSCPDSQFHRQSGEYADYHPERTREDVRAGLDAWCSAVEAALRDGPGWLRAWETADDILRDVVDNSPALALLRELDA